MGEGDSSTPSSLPLSLSSHRPPPNSNSGESRRRQGFFLLCRSRFQLRTVTRTVGLF